MLRLAALKLLSASSMSGKDIAEEISRVTKGKWNPGPGSIYFMVRELLKKGMIAELPKREGNERRYIVSTKGKEELARLSKQIEFDVARQLKLLAVYSGLAGRDDINRKVLSLVESFSG